MLSNHANVAIIGSRTLPDWLDAQIEILARHYIGRGAKIVTGGAPGTDQAAIRGATNYRGRYDNTLQVYLPWESFEEINLANVPRDVTPHTHDLEFLDLLEYYYKAPPYTMRQGTVKLMARNYSIIKESHGVVAFPRTRDGSPTGGTAFGIFVARRLNKDLEIYSIDSLGKWDFCKNCGMHQQIWNCGNPFHELKPYV